MVNSYHSLSYLLQVDKNVIDIWKLYGYKWIFLGCKQNLVILSLLGETIKTDNIVLYVSPCLLFTPLRSPPFSAFNVAM